MQMSSPDLEIRKIGDRALENGLISSYGFVALQKPISFDLYRSWLDKGYSGNMDYLERHAPAKEDPSVLSPRAKSAIVVTVQYVPHPESTNFPLKSARIARYAQGEDYHHWLQKRLKALVEELKSAFPGEEFLTFTDSQPVLERDLAYRAGIGWYGKNTCLIHPKKGSLFLIGEIYTSLDPNASELKASIPVTDHCGKCTRCIDACPTQAIVAPRELDARKCISYLTIENKEDPPEELRSKIGDWLFGCDICQTVCPWNIKVHGEKIEDKSATRSELIADLRFILESSNSQLQKVFANTAISRSAGTKLKRNAIIVCANKGLNEFEDILNRLKTDERLGNISSWALTQLEKTKSIHS
jgi:epoxyqueuosine reductase